jgi:tartrate dehydratase alpha subunit/fumarate hydratase class I-like protein
MESRVRQMTPEEEATLNVAIMQTEEIFNERVKQAVMNMMLMANSDVNLHIRRMAAHEANNAASYKVKDLKEKIADALQDQSPAQRIRSINLY